PSRIRLSVEAMEGRVVPATFTVVNTLDDGSVGSLRWAVDQANTNLGDDLIDFDSKAFKSAKTITLGGTQLELTDTKGTQTIKAPSGGVTVSGGGLSRVFQIDEHVTASITGVTIGDGNAGYYSGGGVANYGTATLTNCIISGNSAFSGGGVFNIGESTLTGCT